MGMTMFLTKLLRMIDMLLGFYVINIILIYRPNNIIADRINCTKKPSTFPVRGPDGL